MDDAQHLVDELLAANARYAERFNMGELRAEAARGIAVLTCIDSRIEPLQMLGLEPGDAKILRNAGARVSDDALRTLALAVERLNVSRVVIVSHTDCAAGTLSDDDLRADAARITLDERIPADVIVAALRYDVRTGRLEQLLP